MKNTCITITLFLLIGCGKTKLQPQHNNTYTPLPTITSWQTDHTSNQSIYQEGTISKILQDDNEGSRHQKFIVKIGNGTTLLIAHNIDISTRIPDLENGATIVFMGEYEWNAKGGVVHWTHQDPQAKHGDGYLLYRGKKYD